MSGVVVVQAGRRRWVANAAIHATMAVWASFAVLWLVWWLPVYVWRQTFTLFFYPAFLCMWLVLEIAAIAAVVFGVIALSLGSVPEKRTAVVVALSAAAVFVSTSFFVLWFGSAPLALFGLDIDGWVSGTRL